MPIITIIIPVYKVESLLRRCIDSLLCQTLSNIEIILVDDGSPDKCGNICDEYSQKDSRVIAIHKENGGLSSARNTGLDICKGEYVMFVDSDDYVEPNFCEEALKTIQEQQVKCVAFGYYEHIDNKVIKFCTKEPRKVPKNYAIESLITSKDVIFNIAWNKIYHRSLFEQIRFPHGRHFEDQGTTYKLFDLAGDIYVSAALLYHYVRRGDSISQTDSVYTVESPKNINDLFDLWYERLFFFKEKYPDVVTIAYKQLVNHVLRGFRLLPWKRNKEIVSKFKNFLDNNEKEIKSLHLGSKTLIMYYSCYPLFKLSIFVYRLKYQ